MAKDHFIPATLIGRFSDDKSQPSRNREIWVACRNGKSPRRSTAQAEGYKANLYNVDREIFSSTNGKAVDNLWSSYEPGLSEALDDLLSHESLRADTWINILVPFVAATFARDHTYKERNASRLTSSFFSELQDARPSISARTDLNLNRVIEMNKFAAKAISSEWKVLEFEEDIVLPDLGYCLIVNDEQLYGADVVIPMIPIDKRHVLELFPSPQRVVAQKGEGTFGEWRVHIYHEKVENYDINSELTRWAQNYVIGNETSIKSVDPSLMAKFSPRNIDEMLAVWPFNVETKSMAGIHAPIAKILNNESVDLDRESLNRFFGISGLDQNVLALIISSTSNLPASRFIHYQNDSVVMNSHFQL